VSSIVVPNSVPLNPTTGKLDAPTGPTTVYFIETVGGESLPIVRKKSLFVREPVEVYVPAREAVDTDKGEDTGEGEDECVPKPKASAQGTSSPSVSKLRTPGARKSSFVPSAKHWLGMPDGDGLELGLDEGQLPIPPITTATMPFAHTTLDPLGDETEPPGIGMVETKGTGAGEAGAGKPGAGEAGAGKPGAGEPGHCVALPPPMPQGWLDGAGGNWQAARTNSIPIRIGNRITPPSVATLFKNPEESPWKYFPNLVNFVNNASAENLRSSRRCSRILHVLFEARWVRVILH
jgi:hypothetical protein